MEFCFSFKQVDFSSLYTGKQVLLVLCNFFKKKNNAKYKQEN